MRLIVLLTLAHLGFVGARLTLALKAVELQASAFQIGALMSLLMVVSVFVAVPIGRWTDRSGFVPPTSLGLGLLTLACVLGGLWPTLPVLFVVSVLTGSGYMLAHVSVNNVIGHVAGPSGRAQAFGFMGIGFSLSGFAGPMLTGVMIDQSGHALTFALLAVFPLASLMLLRGCPPVVMRAHGEAGTGPARSGVIDLLRDPPLRAAFIVGGLIAMGWDLFTFLMPLYGARIGLSATAIGVVIGAFGLGTFAVRLAIPWLMRRMDEWRLLGVALALTAACYLVFPLFDTVSALLPLAFVLGMVLGCGQPMGMSLVHVTAPPSRTGEAVGLRSTITSTSQVVLPLMFGALGSAVGMWPLFLAAALALGAGSWYARRCPKPG